MEIWKDIPNYEGLYQASTLGRIKGVDRRITVNAQYNKRVWKERILKGRGKSNSGYRVNLWKNGECKEYLVARLIAETFLGSPKKGDTVNHKDGDRFNNQLSNLEWLSRGDNIRYGFEHGQYSTQIAITIKQDSRVQTFRSLAECDRFLGKSVGYTSFMRIQKRPIRDKDGRVWSEV